MMKLNACLMVALVCSCHGPSHDFGAARAHCKQLENSLDVFKAQHGSLPSREAGLAEVMHGSAAIDPWGVAFSYDPEAKPRVRSAGPNKILGDADDVTADSAP